MQADRLGPSARFFFYGTLLDPDIRRRVFGHDLDAASLSAATIAGFRRVRAAGKWYPILVPGQASDTVDGLLATGLDRRAIAALIAYEGAGYDLVPIKARSVTGADCDALVFLPVAGVLKPGNAAWDLERWQIEDKPRVMRGPI